MNHYDRSGRRVDVISEPVLRAIRINPYVAAQYLVSEEHHQNWIASVELDRSVRRGSATRNGAAAPVAALRQRIGAVLIGAGRRLTDATDATAAAEPATRSMP